MLLKLICCDVFARMVCGFISGSPHIVDVEFIPMLSHNEPAKLRAELQGRIDAAVGRKKYEKLIMGFGLCGNTTSGLTCGIPMILPRAHDCCTMFMGSKESFMSGFGGSLSARWSSNGYYERSFVADTTGYYSTELTYKTNAEYLKLVEDYGEDNAEYVWTTMHPQIESKEAVYIRIDGFEYNDSLMEYRRYVEGEGCELKVLEGDKSFIEELVNGPWDNKKFLHVAPGEKVVPIYDMEEVFSAS